PARAIVQVVVKGPGAIKGNYYILDADGELIAHFAGLRGQAIPIRKPVPLASMASVEVPWLLDGTIMGSRGVSAGIEDVIRAAGAARLSGGPGRKAQTCASLLDQWASAAAYELAQALQHEGIVDPA